MESPCKQKAGLLNALTALPSATLSVSVPEKVGAQGACHVGNEPCEYVPEEEGDWKLLRGSLGPGPREGQRA